MKPTTMSVEDHSATLIRGADGALYAVSAVTCDALPSSEVNCFNVDERKIFIAQSDDHASARSTIDPGDHASARSTIDPGDHASARSTIDPGDHASARSTIDPGDHASARSTIDPGDQLAA